MRGRLRVRKVLWPGLIVLAVAATGCGDSSGPSDTTIVLGIDPVPAATNQNALPIQGTTDANARVTITAPADTVSSSAAASGAFSFSIELILNALNEIEVRARDRAGNVAVDTLEVIHDDINPSVEFTAPGTATPTSGQSGFGISLSFTDENSGIDPAAFVITADQALGGVFQQDGTFTTLLPPGTDLAPIFGSVGASGASLTVPDSLVFPAGPVRLTAGIEDAAGNPDEVDRLFTVGPDPDRLIVVDTETTAGSDEVPVLIGLANANPVDGVQFDVTFDPGIVTAVDSVTVTDRTGGFDDPPFRAVASGRVRVLIFDSGGGSIDAGQGPVAVLWITMAPDVAPGDYTLTLEAIVTSDESGGTSSPATTSGTLTVL